RMVAKYLAPELGAANVIVLNQPGAGGLLAANRMFQAKPDGLQIQLMNASGMLTAELGGAEGVNFKSGEFSWIGRVSGEPDVIAVGPNSDIKTVDDLKAKSAAGQVRIGSSGVGDVDYIEAQILTKIFGLNSNIITGFSSAPEVYASLGRGELDVFTSSLSAGQQAKIAELATLKWLMTTEADPDVPDIEPIAAHIDAQYLPLVKAHTALVASGRALAAPPKMDEATLKCLRDSFDRTVKNPALLEEAEKLGRPVDAIDGAEMQEIMSTLTSNPPAEYVELLKASYTAQ
ncbi:MAG: tripartite tricarboxylate transporter substrate-binding protein, partial [Pseudomonadota bacterium]|nr:tripartite tricarboxylate transporter substrate-binding protein [Pseudomonadota bacterium]